MRDIARKGDADPAILSSFLARYDQIKGHTSHVFPPGVQNIVFANDFGQDLYGYWMDLKAGGVVQRLRYISPGSYIRGSAREEWGRLPGEPILEPTTISRGFWLGDSDVTQGLYEGVMGADENHSLFQVTGRSAEIRRTLPVENVSYAHAVNFMNKLSISAVAHAPGMGIRPHGSNYMYAGTGRPSDMAWFWDEKRDANGQIPTNATPSVTDHGTLDVHILHELDLEQPDGLRTYPPRQTETSQRLGTL